MHWPPVPIPILAPSAPPTNFEMSVTDTMICLSWNPPPESEQNGVIVSYTLACTIDDEPSISHKVKNFVLNFCADLYLTNQDFSCSVLASTTAGDGPTTESITMTTESKCSDVIKYGFQQKNISYFFKVQEVENFHLFH